MENIFSTAKANEFSYFVFFDIDRTITRVISGKALAIEAYKRKLMSRTDLLKAVFISLAYRLNLRDPVRIIDDMVSWVKGLPEKTMADLCADVFRFAVRWLIISAWMTSSAHASKLKTEFLQENLLALFVLGKRKL
jgi:phosphoserine phosphatase